MSEQDEAVEERGTYRQRFLDLTKRYGALGHKAMFAFKRRD